MFENESKRIVPVSTLCQFLENPAEAYDSFVKGVRAPLCPSVIGGELEHISRRLVSEKAKGIYLMAETEADLRASYEMIDQCVQEAIVSCERRYGHLGISLDHLGNEVANRLRIEEDERIAAAGNLMNDGVQGFDLVSILLPHEVEFDICSEELGLKGRIDAIAFLDGCRFPIEYKTGRNLSPIFSESHRVQVAAYCMLIEERYESACNLGEIYYTRYFRRVPVFVTYELKRRVLEIRDNFLRTCSCQGLGIAYEEVIGV